LARIPYLAEIMDRSRMTGRVVPLTSPEAGDPRAGGSLEERLAAVAELSVEAWRLAGRPLPSYTRATMPVVLATLKDHAGSL
jgi:hypothetical protein